VTEAAIGPAAEEVRRQLLDQIDTSANTAQAQFTITVK